MSFSFEEQIQSKTNEELVVIYTNADQYQSAFVDLAEAELRNRGIALDSLDRIREEKVNAEVAAMDNGKQGNLIYLILISISALAGGLIAIIGGYIYAFSKQTAPTGERYFVYNEQTRLWGQIIFYVGIVVFLLGLLFSSNRLYI
jgi:hypothetical protein